MPADSPQTIAGCGRCLVNPAKESGLCETCELVLSPRDMVPEVDHYLRMVGEQADTEYWQGYRDALLLAKSGALSASPVGEQAGGAVVGWRPIETAPKDGTPILVWSEVFRPASPIIVRWDTDKYAKKPVPRWESREAIYGRRAFVDCPPLFWMPLPPAPSTTSTAEQVGTEAEGRSEPNHIVDATEMVAPSPGEGDAPVAWRWSRDMTRLPWSQTLLFLDPIDEDGCQQVRLGLSTDAMNAEAWSPLPGESRPTPAIPEGAADKLAHILRRKLERGEVIDAEAIERALTLAAYRQDPTEDDRTWAARESARVDTPEGLREKVADIINPWAARFHRAGAYNAHANLEYDEALKKADIILSVLQPQAQGGE